MTAITGHYTGRGEVTAGARPGTGEFCSSRSSTGYFFGSEYTSLLGQFYYPNPSLDTTHNSTTRCLNYLLR